MCQKTHAHELTEHEPPGGNTSVIHLCDPPLSANMLTGARTLLFIQSIHVPSLINDRFIPKKSLQIALI